MSETDNDQNQVDLKERVNVSRQGAGEEAAVQKAGRGPNEQESDRQGQKQQACETTGWDE